MTAPSKLSLDLHPLPHFSTTWGICFSLKGNPSGFNMIGFVTVLPRSGWRSRQVALSVESACHSRPGFLPVAFGGQRREHLPGYKETRFQFGFGDAAYRKSHEPRSGHRFGIFDWSRPARTTVLRAFNARQGREPLLYAHKTYRMMGKVLPPATFSNACSVRSGCSVF